MLTVYINIRITTLKLANITLTRLPSTILTSDFGFRQYRNVKRCTVFSLCFIILYNEHTE